MSPIRGVVLALLVLSLGGGCIIRTTERQRGLKELPRASKDAPGTVSTSERIWFWQGEFWNP